MDPTEQKKGLIIGGEIERVNGKELSYIEFVGRYLSKNQPVVVTGLMDDWRACKDWVDDNGDPNLRFFSTHFGESKVQVANCGSREFTDQRRIEMSVLEFIEYWVAVNEENKEIHHNISTGPDYDKDLLYLKDWHFVKEYPEYEAYLTPLFFNDDWLNIYLDEYHMHNDPDYLGRNEVSCSDYRFVYMGPKGTWTPLHADVFRSYSWSANVCGSKLWLFLPPGQRHLVFDRYLKNCVYDIFEDVSESKFPGFKKAVWLECTQQKNEIIFVPSGWYHQVHNLELGSLLDFGKDGVHLDLLTLLIARSILSLLFLLEDTISINHNWFNAYNLDWVWDLLVGDYNEAKELIEDIRDICDDFEALCQRNLAANTGMNFFDFFTFIIRITFANMSQLYNLLEGREIHSLISCSWAQHIISNLLSIKRVASKMKSTCLAEDGGISSDIQKILKDSSFLDMCSSLSTTYEKLHEQCCHNSCDDDVKPLKNGVEHLDFIGIAGSTVSNSRDLISLIDCILKDFTLTFDNLPVSEPRDENSAS